jgi:aryl-alcohol dehydrogenase-like predicted oxidoreductase
MLLCYACRRHQVSLLAYSPLAGGVLSGKYVKPNPPAGARLNLFPGEHNNQYVVQTSWLHVGPVKVLAWKQQQHRQQQQEQIASA